MWTSYEVQIYLMKPFAKHCVLTGSRTTLYMSYWGGPARTSWTAISKCSLWGVMTFSALADWSPKLTQLCTPCTFFVGNICSSSIRSWCPKTMEWSATKYKECKNFRSIQNTAQNIYSANITTVSPFYLSVIFLIVCKLYL